MDPVPQQWHYCPLNCVFYLVFYACVISCIAYNSITTHANLMILGMRIM